MAIFHGSRSAARQHAQKRKAMGLPAKVIDLGINSAKRFGVCLKGSGK